MLILQQSHDIMNPELFIIVITLATLVASNPLVYRVSVGELPEYAQTDSKWVGITRNNNNYYRDILPRTGYPEQANVVARTSNVPECKHTPYTYGSQQQQPVQAQQQQQVQSQQQGFVRIPQSYPQYQPYYYYSSVVPISQQQKPILTPDQYTRQPVGGVVQQPQQAKPLQTTSVQGVTSSQQGWQSYLCSVFPSLSACGQNQPTQPLYSSYAGYPSYSGYTPIAPVPVYYVIQTPEGRPVYAPGIIRPVQVPLRPEEPVKEKPQVESEVAGEGEVVKETQKEVPKEVQKEVVKPEDVVKTEVKTEGEKVSEEKVQVKESVPVKSEAEKTQVKKEGSEKVVEKKQ